MSGGKFDYYQYHIGQIADSIETELDKQGKVKRRDDMWSDEEYYREHPDERFYYTHPKEIQEKMKEAIKYLRIAEVYAQRVDWYLSGDDGDDNFLKRLDEDLKKIEQEFKVIIE